MSSNAIHTDTYSYTGPDQTDRVQANNTSYTYGSLGLGSATTSGSSVYYTRDSSGKLISERTPSGTYYYLTNNIGSVMLVADSTGKVQNSYSYDPLGNSLGKTENVTNPWQFAGGYLDATTGLYKFGTRYYNLTVGRWTQPDPKGGKIVEPTSLDLYVYANDDPINVVDPAGTSGFFNCLGGIITAIASLVGGLLLVDVVGMFLFGLSAATAEIGIGLLLAWAALIWYIAGVIGVFVYAYNSIASGCGLPQWNI